MTQVLNTPPDRRGLPGWVPDAARHYVSHVEMGQPIRALTRSAECHAFYHPAPDPAAGNAAR